MKNQKKSISKQEYISKCGCIGHIINKDILPMMLIEKSCGNSKPHKTEWRKAK